MTDETKQTDLVLTEHTRWKTRRNKPQEQFLHWLSPIRMADYIACEIDGKPRHTRAKERGVSPATISHNVNKAKEQLREIAAQELLETSND